MKRPKARIHLAIALIAISLPAAVLADDAPAVNPSRPSITNSPAIGTPGAIELNVGAGGNASGWSTPLLLKYTVSETLELRVGTEGLAIDDSSAASPDTALFWVQWAPSVSDRFDLALAAGAAEDGGDAGLQCSIQLAAGMNLGALRLEANAQSSTESDEAAARAAVHSASLIASRSLGRWTPFVEGAVFLHRGRAHAVEYRSMIGLAFALSNTVVLDAAVEADPGEPSDAAFHFGISFLVGGVLPANPSSMKFK